ncbi:MAG TPA: hypothetical protein VI792_02075 [Candidatus Eisenbacteria bacterium]
MNRIPLHTLENAPEASRPMLEILAHRSQSVGRLLNLHAEMAHAPVVLAAYTGMRRAVDEHATLDPRTRTAVMLASGAVQGSAYPAALNAMLAGARGWSEAEAAALRAGDRANDRRLEALLAVVREAARESGRVSETAWSQARAAGWTAVQLLEAFTVAQLTLFVGAFTHLAGTTVDVPAAMPARAGAHALEALDS